MMWLIYVITSYIHLLLFLICIIYTVSHKPKQAVYQITFQYNVYSVNVFDMKYPDKLFLL